MKDFDPFAATWQEACASPDEGTRFQMMTRWMFAQDLVKERTQLEADPLRGVALCVRYSLIAPDWLANAFCRRYDSVTGGRVATWDAAFGPANPLTKRKRIGSALLQRRHGVAVMLLFHGDGKLPNTPAGRKQAAARLGITERQVRALLPTTRTNTKRSDGFGAGLTGYPEAHNPFGSRQDERTS